jgi:hypothetical protein
MEPVTYTSQIKIVNPHANADFFYGPYESIENALETIIPEMRVLGRTIGIIRNEGSQETIDEYWFKDSIEDSGLILKSSISKGSKITLEFMSGLLITNIYAPNNLQIEEIIPIVNSPVTVIKVNDIIYTLGTPILQGNKITIEVNITSVINLIIQNE